mgnify:CR=1 FL=1|jgi:hypothetical protein
MIIKNNQIRYFIISSFQIKFLFYPIFLWIILEFLGLRFDILSALLISLLCTAIRFDDVLLWLCKKLDNKLIGKKGINWGLLVTGCS